MKFIEQLAGWMRPVLDLPPVQRTRRNHGLEHATIHVLSSRVRGLQMAGRSDAGGFVLLGDAPTEQIERAVNDALKRMQAGEHQLAVHPNCGTNLVTTGLMTTSAALLGFAGTSRRVAWERLPMVLMAVMATILFSQPIGLSLQKYITTDGDPRNLEIVSIVRREVGSMTVHRVTTKSS